LLARDPLYFELLIYIYCHYNIKPLGDTDIFEKFGASQIKIKTYLENLYDYGLIEKNELDQYVSKEWIFIPHDKEFREVRNINFKRAVHQYFKKKPETFFFRTTVTRFLTVEQQREAESLATAFYNSIVDLPDETDGQQDLVPFTIGIFGSERNFGNG
jgi:hypothetical protein